MAEHLEMVEMSETMVEGLEKMEMRFGWDLMAKGWSGIWFMTMVQKELKNCERKNEPEI